MVHSEGKFFKCGPCDKMFKQSANLRNHLKTHLKEEPIDTNLIKEELIDDNNNPLKLEPFDDPDPEYPSDYDQVDVKSENSFYDPFD